MSAQRLSIPPSGFIEPCLPTSVARPPRGPEWQHELKHDGFRLMARRTGGGHARLFTRRGADWAARYPHIVKAVQTLACLSATIDGEAVYCGPAGSGGSSLGASGLGGSGLAAPQGRERDRHVLMYAFDLLELNGTDLRELPLAKRRAMLARLLRRAPDGIQFSEHGDDGSLLFEQVCKMGLEGIVSKRRDSVYRSGRSRLWLETRNPASPVGQRFDKGT